ncbi:heterogeneous nuclear ribonucleoprotein A1 isoform X2 [Exaiptasia diaphana]|uniref:RRM domain-containing protein n=1 Tax=Exaiptasia diaphana TaxID=2652724 RepID=A0A913YWU9_EXADI|nr:heterogeneous nuclear ribonucleoprotein A1 isoform X2 [Exaiptasia diaphana]XP_028519538.1 heterogeneous nuclear ribonucleoprotein A1 isoform X2 [Exaiptasia diaphana]
MSESEKLRKIFIGGLNWETEEEGLKDYFSQWGTIVDCVIMKKDGKSRGFGFVTYSSPQSVDDVLKVRGHVLDGRDIEPKRSVPKDEAKNPMALTKTRKIFVGGLASTTTEDDIRDYFTEVCKKAGVGQVIDVDLKKDRENSNRIRGFAFVTFDDEEIAEKVCSMKYHEIRMKQCEVKKAEPQSMLRKKHEEEYGSDRDRRDRDRDRDRDSRDRGDRDRDRDRDRRDRDRDRDRGRDSDMSSYFPFGFNPAAFGPGGFGPGFGFGGMGFSGFGPGFGYGGFPGGFGPMSAFSGFGGGSERGGSSYDKGGYSGSGSYASNSDRDSGKSHSPVTGGSTAVSGRSNYDSPSSGGYGYPFAGMGAGMGASPADWSNFQAMMSSYGYGGGGGSDSQGQGSVDAPSKSYTSAGDAGFPLSNYNQIQSSYGPMGRGATRGSSDVKSDRGYRPY